MRPVVFGPSPLMEAALGVFKGQELGRERELAQVRAQREAEANDRRAQLDALTIAQRTIANTEATDAQRQRETKAARVQADAERLRASPFNADGKYGQPGEPVDVEHDYAADLEKEAKVGALKQALVAGGMPEADAEARARWNVDKDALANEATTRRQAREKQAADIARVKAETAATWARARNGGTVSNPKLDRQINDQEQVVSAARRAVPTKRTGLAQVIAGQPLDAAAAAAFTADSTARARTADTEDARLAALKAVRGDPEVMARGGAGSAPDPEAVAQAMAAELQEVAARVQRILEHPRATPEQKDLARAELSRLQTAIIRKYQGETR